ncbi:MAG: dephospho-CoA kinase [Actinomycetota bacterium]|nr:dephospho-CoA kinase [Actinomycetota bacterium]
MIAVGLTGGIGSGKSTAAAMLAGKGATVIDADALAREAVEPGTAALAAVVERFGPEVLAADGRLDRAKLASIVFRDEKARADLEAIVHPAVAVLLGERLDALSGSDGIVVVEIPLLAEAGGRAAYRLGGVVVVDAPSDLAVSRLVAGRAMDPADALRRVAAQASQAQRLALADYVISNTGSLEELSAMVDRAWDWMQDLASRKRPRAEPQPPGGWSAGHDPGGVL